MFFENIFMDKRKDGGTYIQSDLYLVPANNFELKFQVLTFSICFLQCFLTFTLSIKEPIFEIIILQSSIII